MNGDPVTDVNGASRAPVVLASAGTYHLPFPRFSDWLETWYVDRPEVDLVVQHGPSRPVHGAENHDILDYAELLEMCRRADVVVLQGGAGGIMDMRSLGIVPIVVPRIPDPDAGATEREVVDDHQLVFTAEMARLGLLHRAVDRDEFFDLLDSALDGRLPLTAQSQVATPGAAAVGTLVDAGVRPRPLTTVVTRLVRTVGLVGWGVVAARLSRFRRNGR